MLSTAMFVWQKESLLFMAVHPHFVYIIKFFAARQIVCSHSIPVHISDISLAENRKLTQKISERGLNCLCLRISKKCDSHRIGSDMPLYYSHILCLSGPKNTKIPPSNQKFLTPFWGEPHKFTPPDQQQKLKQLKRFSVQRLQQILLAYANHIPECSTVLVKSPHFYICLFLQHHLWLRLCWPVAVIRIYQQGRSAELILAVGAQQRPPDLSSQDGQINN